MPKRRTGLVRSMTTVFKSVPVASEVFTADRLSSVAGRYPLDVATLGWEERVKTRARRRSDAGFEFATTLARGTVLRGGDCLVFDEARRVVRIAELEEPVLLVRPRSSIEWALYAYHIGNSHQPVMLSEEGIVCPDYLGMAQLLDFHRIPFTRERRAFTPVGMIPDHQHGPER